MTKPVPGKAQGVCSECGGLSNVDACANCGLPELHGIHQDHQFYSSGCAKCGVTGREPAEAPAIEKTCAHCKWSTLRPANKGMHPPLVCELPEGFLMDAQVPYSFGCNDWEAIESTKTPAEAEGRPKRDKTKVIRNAGWKKPDGLGGWTLSGSGVPIESGAWVSLQDHDALIADYEALESHCTTLESRLEKLEAERDQWKIRAEMATGLLPATEADLAWAKSQLSSVKEGEK